MALEPGARVRVPSLGLEGELESVGDSRAFILVRGRRVRVATADLVLAESGGAPAGAGPARRAAGSEADA